MEQLQTTARSKLRWIFWLLGCLVALVVLFYVVENWRGKRAWEKYKRDLEAKGQVFEWNAYIPPPVPDEQNFFKAPKMTEWFVKGQSQGTNGLSTRLSDPRTSSVASGTNAIVTEADARSYLAWSAQFDPDFALIREALKRPYARMDGDYSRPFEIPIPNFVAMRTLAQTLAQRAHCNFLLRQPEQALAELTLLNDSRRLLQAAPTGKPMTLVSAMINVAVTGLYADTLAEGFRRKAWQEPQLVVLQEQLARIDLPPLVAEAFRLVPAATCHTFEIEPLEKLLFMGNSDKERFRKFAVRLIPRGWIYQNMVNVAVLEHKSHFTRAYQSCAANQTKAHQAQIACALERYRLARGEYPEKLDALTPQFIANIPHDIIGGQPLHYRRTADGKFLLYSVGWNEKDDGGQPGLTKNRQPDLTTGDWVWNLSH